MTLNDLQALTFATIENYTETEGVAKCRGIRYRTATYRAIDNDQEREYRVRVSSNNGPVKIDDLGLTRAQRQCNEQADYDALRPGTRAAIDALGIDFSNLTQKTIIGDAMEGRVHVLSLKAVLGGGPRAERFRQLFPTVATVDAAVKALQEFAEKMTPAD